MSYQWRFNGTNIAGATNSNVVVTNVQLASSGDYTVLVSDIRGGVLSQPGRLTVLVGPAITQQPQSQVVPIGGTATFSISATGTLPMYFRWRRGGATLTNIALNSGTSVFTITNVQTNHAGIYTVVITNQANTVGILSANATLTVTNMPAPLTLIAPQLLSDGSFRLMLSGETNKSYVIEGTANLVNWLDLITLSNSAGQIQWTDTNTTTFRNRFYRARALP